MVDTLQQISVAWARISFDTCSTSLSQKKPSPYAFCRCAQRWVNVVSYHSGCSSFQADRNECRRDSVWRTRLLHTGQERRRYCLRLERLHMCLWPNQHEACSGHVSTDDSNVTKEEFLTNTLRAQAQLAKKSSGSSIAPLLVAATRGKLLLTTECSHLISYKNLDRDLLRLIPNHFLLHLHGFCAFPLTPHGVPARKSFLLPLVQLLNRG